MEYKIRGFIMEEDNSNSVEAVEYIDSQDEDPDGDEKRPIMLLLRRLIRNKQNTVMTNAQIIDILQSEFNICVNSSHELEVDIYIKIIKKYLKDWPQWEELERISTKLSLIKDFEAVSKVLNHKYKNLKEYLGVMLEAAKPLAQEAVRNINSNSNQPETSKVDESIETNDVIMEIQCTREQLNNLFFRKPRLDLNNTVFNMTEITPSRINLRNLTFDEILNGCWVKIIITLPHFSFVRELSYKLSHVLINKARKDRTTTDVSFSRDFEVNCGNKSKNQRICSRNSFLQQFSTILQESAKRYPEMYDFIRSIVELIKNELDVIDPFTVPASYRRHANKYNYVRYLYTDNNQNSDPRYDLQLEETITPMYMYIIDKVQKSDGIIPLVWEWLKTECMVCKIKITGTKSTSWKEAWESHFSEKHSNETDWQCAHCKRLFGIAFLAKNKWYHEC
ncbi:hypothetical protein B5X24_HaOG209917 [Helicoverpa armigera]|uniref:Uncharacterized protein n=1 Tax=Helicoverpa armigera TaxID=29058 RepID=A0A2W1BHJ9_HELAM|nr:hypothetical protein B5X24_HaOG209917 [Helicoverpa armigera]